MSDTPPRKVRSLLRKAVSWAKRGDWERVITCTTFAEKTARNHGTMAASTELLLALAKVNDAAKTHEAATLTLATEVALTALGPFLAADAKGRGEICHRCSDGVAQYVRFSDGKDEAADIMPLCAPCFEADLTCLTGHEATDRTYRITPVMQGRGQTS